MEHEVVAPQEPLHRSDGETLLAINGGVVLVQPVVERGCFLLSSSVMRPARLSERRFEQRLTPVARELEGWRPGKQIVGPGLHDRANTPSSR